jgi:hypothetical protein
LGAAARERRQWNISATTEKTSTQNPAATVAAQQFKRIH